VKIKKMETIIRLLYGELPSSSREQLEIIENMKKLTMEKLSLLDVLQTNLLTEDRLLNNNEIKSLRYLLKKEGLCLVVHSNHENLKGGMI